MDFSTIDTVQLRKHEVVIASRKYVQDSCGNGCAGDAPGYPSYFTKTVYGANDRMRCMAIELYGTLYAIWNADHDERDSAAILRRLWLPLPIDHQRVRLWIRETYRHHSRCYNGWGDDMVIYPVPAWQLKVYTYDPRWKEEFITAHKAEVDASNERVIKHAQALATPENHNAVRLIRKFYPEHAPDLSLIENSPTESRGFWWETEAERPSEADCAATQRWHKKHPFSTSWCQWCGRRYAPDGVLLPEDATAGQ